MRRHCKKMGIWLARLVIPLFYDREYLCGRFFETQNVGWRWALNGVLWQKILRVNSHIPWPCSPNIKISNPNNMHFHVDDLNNFQGFGCYFQNFAGNIYIGKGSYIAPNVGLITCNHDLLDPDKHQEGKDIKLGRKCWIGMNSVILPGVVLGDHTVVAAGSVVTKSFEDGYCVVAGSPAKVIRTLNKSQYPQSNICS